MPIDFIEEAPGLDFQPEGFDGLDFQPEPAPGALGGAARSLQRGVLSAQAIAPTIALANAPKPGASLRQQHRGFTQAMEDPAYMSGLMLNADDPAKLQKVESLFGPQRRTEQITAPKDAIRGIWAGVVADLSKERDELPKSTAQQALAQAATTGDKWAVFRKYPGQVVSSIVLESLPPSIAGAAVGGMAGGPVGVAAGAGMASAAQEFSNEFLAEAARAGFNPTDEVSLSKFLTSPAYDAAVSKALTRASIVGGVDAATAGAAGRFIQPALKLGLAKVGVASAKEVGLQAAGGVTGELAAQTATKGDQPYDWFDIAMEGVAEIATGPAEAFSNIREGLKGTEPQIQAPKPALVSPEGVPSRSTPPEPPAQITPDALKELESALRGNQVRSPAIPRKEPEAVQPAEVVTVDRPVVSEQDLANRRYMELKDKEARETLAAEKDYPQLTDDELDMLAALGDADAKREQRKRRAAKPLAKPLANIPENMTEPAPVSISPTSNEAEKVNTPPAKLDFQPETIAPTEAPKRPIGETTAPISETKPAIPETPAQDPVEVAREILRHRGRVSVSPVQRIARIKWADAEKAIQQLEQSGEIHRPDPGGTWVPVPAQQKQETTDLRNTVIPPPADEQAALQAELDAAQQEDTVLPENDKIEQNAPDLAKIKATQTEIRRLERDIATAKASLQKPELSPGAHRIDEEWLASLEKKLAAAQKRAAKLVAAGKPATAPIDNPDAVERALDALKIDVRPGVQAFGLIPDLWNRLIEAVRAAYRAGKSIKEAIDTGIQWLNEHNAPENFDEAGARKELSRTLHEDIKADRPRARLAALETQMRDIEARGEQIPQEMLDEYHETANEQAELIREGKASVGSRVDDGLEPREQSPQPKSSPSTNVRESISGQLPDTPKSRIPPWKGAERLPRENPLRTLWNALANWRRKSGDWTSRRAARMDITVGRDAADNRATRLANEASLNVRLVLNRAFGDTGAAVRTKHEAREAALTFAVEADGNRAALREFWDSISNSPAAETGAGKKALAAIEYAETNWEKLQPAAERYKQLTTIERETELNEGVNSHEWEGGYVFHRWKKDSPGSGADPTQSRPAGTPFRKPRSVPTYAAGIAEGRAPVTLNGLELLAERVANGQRRLNELNWVHGLRSMEDPVTGEPVVVDVERRPRKPANLPTGERAAQQEAAGLQYKPEWVTKAPQGYTIWRFGDLEVAVHESFAKLMTTLTSPSFFKDAPFKKVFGFMKSALLMFDTFHLGRMAAWRTMYGLEGGYRKGQTLLDFTAADIREMAANGEIPAQWAEGLLENKRKLDLAIRTGFNVGNVLDNSWGDVLHNLPGIGRFNKWLFGEYQRGAMAEAWLIEFQRMTKAMPNASEAAVARKVSRDLNYRFGNLNRQGLFKSRTAQDLARFVFLAPQWNEALIRSELGAIGQTLKSPIDSIQQRRLVVGSLMKATGMMAVGTFIANQILNYAFRGKPTWDNDEEGWDKKISAWIPDAISGGPGFFLNPLALPAEYTHLIEGNLHRSGGDWTEAGKRILNSRLHSASRAALMLFTREDVLGKKLRGGEVLPAMAKAMIPAPIASGTVISAGKQLATGEPSEQFPGQYQKQLMASFGVKTDQAPNAEQRIRNLARQFNAEKGIVPSAEFYSGDFDALNKALRIGNMSDAKEALEELLTKKTPKQISEHYQRAAKTPFTGQLAREREFWKGLTDEQKERYKEAREKRRKIGLQARTLLREQLQRPR